jgi:hypothetical protein
MDGVKCGKRILKIEIILNQRIQAQHAAAVRQPLSFQEITSSIE